VWDLRFAHGEGGRTLTTKTDALGEHAPPLLA